MKSVRLPGSLACLLWASACAGRAPLVPAATRVEWAEAVPAGYEPLGSVRADCARRAHDGALSGTPASSLLCSRAELERALIERARKRGGTVLAAERCRQHGKKLACAAVVARPGEAGGPARGRGDPMVVDEDALALSASVAGRILIDLEPVGPRLERRARGAAEVSEFRLLPLGHRELGLLRAHCQAGDCDEAQAHAGLRAAAGGLGATALVGVRCFALAGEESCVATLAATERDPETDPRAR